MGRYKATLGVRVRRKYLAWKIFVDENYYACLAATRIRAEDRAHPEFPHTWKIRSGQVGFLEEGNVSFESFKVA